MQTTRAMTIELSSAEENDLARRLEERYREEIERQDRRWQEWVGDLDRRDVSRIFAAVMRDSADALLEVARIQNDYVQHRLVNGYRERAEELARMTWCEGAAT